MDKSLVIGIVGIILALIFGIPTLIRRKSPKMKRLSADERLQKINDILLKIGPVHINLIGSAFIFMPSGEIVFGAGWVNKEWLEFLEYFISQNKDKLAPSEVGEKYYICDLITGNNIRIPLHPVKGMTFDKDGIALGHMYALIKY